MVTSDEKKGSINDSPSTIVGLVARRNPFMSSLDFLTFQSPNVMDEFNLLTAMYKSLPLRLLFASTQSVNGKVQVNIGTSASLVVPSM